MGTGGSPSPRYTPDSGINSEPLVYGRRFVRVAVTPVSVTEDQVSDAGPPVTTPLGSVFGGVDMEPDDGGGPLNVGTITRAALLGSVPRPNGGDMLRLLRTLKKNDTTYASRFLIRPSDNLLGRPMVMGRQP